MTRLPFRITSGLAKERLAIDLYTPVQALAQLIANSFDAQADTIRVEISGGTLGNAGVETVEVSDDGLGIDRARFDLAFLGMGEHFEWAVADGALFKPFGSKGIGRFSVYRLGYLSEWETIAEAPAGGRRLLAWTMDEHADGVTLERDEPVPDDTKTGTRIRIHVSPADAGLQRSLGATDDIISSLLAQFAARLLRKENKTRIFVNGELVDVEDAVIESEIEDLGADQQTGRPEATLTHVLVKPRLKLDRAAAVYVTGDGWTYEIIPLPRSIVDGAKYAGYLESPAVTQHTTAAKTQLVSDQPAIDALVKYATTRAEQFLASRREKRQEEWIEVARKHEDYPFRSPPPGPAGAIRKAVYDRVLILANEAAAISTAPEKVQGLVFKLLLRAVEGEDDLAEVLEHVLGLQQEDVAKFARLLRASDLQSVIRVASRVIERDRLLLELREILYGTPSAHILERRQLQKLLELNTWVFGERYNLVTADQQIRTSVERAREQMKAGWEQADKEPEAQEGVRLSREERQVTDFYLAATCREGEWQSHLIVEIKKPGVKLTDRHLSQLRRYAETIVNHPEWGVDGAARLPDGRARRHQFRFVLISSSMDSAVEASSHNANQPIGRYLQPTTWAHPAELDVLTWGSLLDQRAEELAFLSRDVAHADDPRNLRLLRQHYPDIFGEDGRLPERSKSRRGRPTPTE